MTGNSNNHKTKENEKSSSPEDPKTRGNKKENKTTGATQEQQGTKTTSPEDPRTRGNRENSRKWLGTKNKTYFYVNSGGLKKENKTTGETQEQQTPTGPWFSKLKFTERRNERRRGETKSNLTKLLKLKTRKPKIFGKLKNWDKND